MDKNHSNNSPYDHTVAIKWSLFRNLIILIIIISIGILFSIAVIGKQSIAVLSKEIINKTSLLSFSSIEQVFSPVKRMMKISQQLGDNGIFIPESTESMNRMFMPVLEQLNQVTSLNTGDAEGNGYLLLELKNSWKNRVVRSEYTGKKTLWFEYNRKNGKLISKSLRKQIYDPRKRPWYKLATANKTDHYNSILWTEPYVFFTTKDLGITAVVKVKPAKSIPYFLAMDIMLKDISEHTYSQHPSENGFVTVLSKSGSVIGLPWHSKILKHKDRKSLYLQPVEKLLIQPLTTCFSKWQKKKNKTGNIFMTVVNGKTWWASFRPYYLDKEDFFIVVVMIPESDLMSGLHYQQLIILIITILALVLAGLMAIILAKRYSSPLELLVKQTEAISELNLKSEDASIQTDIREVACLAEAHRKMKSALNSFTRYIPIDVVKELIQRGEAAQVGGIHKYVTVLFTDITEFTKIAEGMPPEKITHHMTKYFDLILPILKQHHATIDKLIGDAIIAFWNAPGDLENHESLALKAVIECQKKLHRINKEWRENGLPELHTRFGLHAGETIVGNVGSSVRLDYTALGDTVNFSSRLEGLNKFYGTEILVSETIKIKNDNICEFRKIDLVLVKGKKKAIPIYEPISSKNTLSEDIRHFRDQYEKTLDLYQHRQFEKALMMIPQLQALKPNDMSVKFLAKQINTCLTTPPPENWRGATEFTEK